MIQVILPDGSAHPIETTIVLGRAPDRDGVVGVTLDDSSLSVSRNHALLRPTNIGTVEIMDLGTSNGTSILRSGGSLDLEPHRATEFLPPLRLRCGDVIVFVAADTKTADTVVVGRTSTGQTPASARAARVTLTVRELIVETNGRRRLDRVDLDAQGGDMIGILGTSGAGKSTFIKAIAGVDPASSGTIVLDGVDVYSGFDELRHRIGYVPQDDILHPTLTVRETLQFAARLRLPEEIHPDEREARVNAVLDELGLTPRADARVNELSGGQRKRVNVAVELLTSPTLLILDEPTSGLDPGNERIAMELFRTLATGDRVVLGVTHSTDSLQLCDRVVLLGSGGVKVYDGHIRELSAHFDGRMVNEIFAHLERTADIGSMRIPPAAPVVADVANSPRPPERLADRIRTADLPRLCRQLNILAQRYIRVIQSDRRNSIILSAQAGVIAVLMLAVFGADSFEPGSGPSKAGNVLMALALASIYLGASNAIREVVKERPILQREMALGVSPVAYLGSKLIPLGAFTIVQAAVLVVVGTLRQGQPTGSATVLPAMTEIFLVVATSGVSAVCLGLLLSALSPSADRAMTVLPVVLFAQLLLVGLIFPVSTIGVQQLAWLTSAYWSFGGAASTVDFEDLYCSVSFDADCVWLWSRTPLHWVVSMFALCALGIGALYLAWRSLDRADPARVLERR